MTLEDLHEGALVRGILANQNVTVVARRWHGDSVVTLTFRDADGKVDEKLLYRHDEPVIEIVRDGQPRSFDADGAMLRLVSEAKRISLAHLSRNEELQEKLDRTDWDLIVCDEASFAT